MSSSSFTPSQEAEKALLGRIRTGQLPPGTRLPSTEAIAKDLGFGVNSVQRALARLATLGYLERRPRMGTIVRRQEKKQLSVFVFVGPDLKKEPHHRDRHLTSCIEQELAKAGYLAHVTSNITAVQTAGGAARAQCIEHLRRDFAHHDPVGLIESSAVFQRFHELAPEFARPIVAIKSPHMGGDVSDDRLDFMIRSLHRLCEMGRKRLLWIHKVTGTSPDSTRTGHFWSAISNSPLRCLDVIEINDQDPSQDPEVIVQNRMREFIIQNRQLPPSKRVDCVLVDEDVLMRGVALALLSEQVRIPEELAVCSNTNEGVNINFGVPVIAFQNAVSLIAREAVALLTARILRQDSGHSPVLVKGGGPQFNLQGSLAG